MAARTDLSLHRGHRGRRSPRMARPCGYRSAHVVPARTPRRAGGSELPGALRSAEARCAIEPGGRRWGSGPQRFFSVAGCRALRGHDRPGAAAPGDRGGLGLQHGDRPPRPRPGRARVPASHRGSRAAHGCLRRRRRGGAEPRSRAPSTTCPGVIRRPCAEPSETVWPVVADSKAPRSGSEAAEPRPKPGRQPSPGVPRLRP